MTKPPVTHYFDLADLSVTAWPMIFREFGANGAKHMVFTHTMFSRILQDSTCKKSLRAGMEQAGLTFVDAHAPFGPYEDLNCPVPKLRPQMIERLRLALYIAAEFSVKSVTIHTGNTPFEGYSLAQYDAALEDSLEKLLPLAEKLGVIICIENIWFPTNTPQKLMDCMEKFQSSSLGLCFDAGHANLMASVNADKGEASVAIRKWMSWGLPVPWDDEILDKMLPQIISCHLHDNMGLDDDHLLPGHGNIDWKTVMKKLARAPRLQCLHNEVIAPRKEKYTTIAEMCRTFDDLADMLAQ